MFYDVLHFYPSLNLLFTVFVKLPLGLNWTENTQSFEIYKWDRNLKPSIFGKNGIWISFIPNQIKKIDIS